MVKYFVMSKNASSQSNCKSHAFWNLKLFLMACVKREREGGELIYNMRKHKHRRNMKSGYIFFYFKACKSQSTHLNEPEVVTRICCQWHHLF